jgi:hypothetical protein
MQQWLGDPDDEAEKHWIAAASLKWRLIALPQSDVAPVQLQEG